MKRNLIYKCDVCGWMAETLSGKGCESCATCCGEPLTVLEEKSAESAVEKHVPFAEETPYGMKVRVGEHAPHPMLKEHFVEWIEVIDGASVFRVHLEPGAAPEAVFPVKLRKGLVVREYCNLHGLWRKEI